MTIQPAKLDVVIIGGSLAGLWAGVAIKSLPNISSVTILERFHEQQMQDLGAGIRTSSEAVDAIREFTQTPPEKYATPMDALRSVDREGNLTNDTPTANGWTSTWDQLYRVLRQTFDSDQKCTYRHGCALNHLEEEDKNNMLVHYVEDGHKRTIFAQMIIGADGASSKVRSIVLPQAQRVQVGYALYRGLVPKSQVSEEAGKIFSRAISFSWPIDSQFVSYNVPGNGGPADEVEVFVNWAWYQNKTEDEQRKLLTDKQGRLHHFSLPVGGMRQDEIEKIKAKALKELPPQHSEVVVKTREPFLQVVTDSVSEQNSFYDGKLLLIGDAVGGQRPHTATAFLQCAFHGIMTRKLLRGDITQNEWSRKTYEFSTVLVNRGRELGDILMATMAPPEKVPQYVKLWVGTCAELSQLWDKSIGNLAST